MDRLRLFVVVSVAVASLALSAVGIHVTRRLEPGVPSTPPRRIVALSPGIAEILFALGARDRVVGITDHTTWPPDVVRSKARVGGFMAPSIERVLALHPDLVICREAQPELANRLRRSGLRILSVRDETLRDILASVVTIGSAIRSPSRAERLAASMRNAFDDLRRRAARLPRVPTLIAVGRADATLRAVYAASRRTMLGQILELVGGRNVVGDTTAAYPLVSKEALAAARPEVVVEVVVPPSPFTPEQVRRSWQKMPDLPAVAAGRVFVVQDDAWLIPGPRLVDVARRLFELVHPRGGAR